MALAGGAVGSAQPAAAAVLGADDPGAISGQYIVVFDDQVEGVGRARDALLAAHGGEARFTYRSALRGFAVRTSPTAARGMAADPRVAYVEQDAVDELDAVQAAPPWGLDRIDQRALPLDETYTYEDDGAGVEVYVTLMTAMDTEPTSPARSAARHTASPRRPRWSLSVPSTARAPGLKAESSLRSTG